jgi:hypothetical protein
MPFEIATDAAQASDPADMAGWASPLNTHSTISAKRDGDVFQASDAPPNGIGATRVEYPILDDRKLWVPTS